MPEATRAFSERVTQEQQRQQARQASNGTFGGDLGQRLTEEVERKQAVQAANGTFGDDFGQRLNDDIAQRNQAREAADGTFGDDFGARLTEQLKKNKHTGRKKSRRERREPKAAPVGAGETIVDKTDCVYRIAAKHGHWWETLWDDPANAELKATRKDPGILLPGDRVHVPAIRQKITPGQTEMRHRFRKKSEPSVLTVRVLDNDEPRRNEPYELKIDGQVFEGVTDASGQIVQPIPPKARRGELRIGDDEQAYELRIGRLDPIDSETGVQQRLNNMGWECGQVDGDIGPKTARSLKAFQQSCELEETGEPDEPTQAALLEHHGS